MHARMSKKRVADLFERGASLVEAVAVLPVLLFLVLGLMDFARYMAIKNTLDVAAHQALTLAEVVPDLELQDGDARYEAAKQKIVDRALDVRHHPFFSYGVALSSLTAEEVLNVPKYNEAKTSRDFTEPMKVSLEAELFLLSLPGSSKLPVHSTASGFREPRVKVSYPIPLNCQGNPPTMNEVLVCDCPDGHVSKYNQCTACEPGTVKQDATNCRCVEKVCGPYMEQDPDTCECVCAGGATTGALGCACISDKTDDVGGRCVCKDPDTLHCRPDQIVEQDNCLCVCPPGKVDNGSQCVCRESCPFGYEQQPDCACWALCWVGCSPIKNEAGEFAGCDCGGGDD